jgi:hypothetical protein
VAQPQADCARHLWQLAARDIRFDVHATDGDASSARSARSGLLRLLHLLQRRRPLRLLRRGAYCSGAARYALSAPDGAPGYACSTRRGRSNRCTGSGCHRDFLRVFSRADVSMDLADDDGVHADVGAPLVGQLNPGGGSFQHACGARRRTSGAA